MVPEFITMSTMVFWSRCRQKDATINGLIRASVSSHSFQNMSLPSAYTSSGKLACELQCKTNILQVDLTCSNDVNIPWIEFHHVSAIWTKAKVYLYVAFMMSRKRGSHFAIDLFNVEIMACAWETVICQLVAMTSLTNKLIWCA